MSEILSKQQLKSKETKAKIFRAAKHILQKHGYEVLSIKNICEEAGVSNGSFYHHFKTKDDLLSYYIEEQPNINPDLPGRHRFCPWHYHQSVCPCLIKYKSIVYPLIFVKFP